MKKAISKKRWEEAQAGEKIYHIKDSIEDAYEIYRNTYKYYFKYLNIDKSLNGKSIVEIGPGRISALLFCNNYKKSYIIEPTMYQDIDHLYLDKNITIIKETTEECEFPIVDEVWIFNLMQHVLDPDLLINKCKKNSKIIRFFEPIDLPIDNEHPFSYTKADFVKYFNNSVMDYVSIGEPGFHTANCVYGIYKTNN